MEKKLTIKYHLAIAIHYGWCGNRVTTATAC